MSNWNRFDIIAAYNIYSVYFAGSPYANEIATRIVRIGFTPSPSEETLEGLSEESQDIYLALVAREEGDEAADRARREIRPEAGDVVIHLSNSDDDAMMIIADVKYEHASKWADAVGSLDGGTWESADGKDFVYDILYWRPGLIAELQAEGFRFDQSEYSEPDADDIARAQAAAE